MAYYNHFICGVLLLTLVVVAPQAKAAVTCGTVATSLAPCLDYFQGGGQGAAPPGGCCNGIRSLNAAAQSTPDRQMVCQCLKSAARSMPNVNLGLASAIPPKCGVNIPYKLDPSTDCSTIH